MEFKNSVSILFSNIGYVFKLLVWILISAVIAGGIGFGIMFPIWKALAASTDINGHLVALKDIMEDVWNGSLNMRVAAKDLVPEIINSIKSLNENPGAFAGLIIAALFVYALYCFLRGLSFYSLSDIINNLMAQNTRFGFASNMALNMNKNIRFSLARLSVSFPIDVAFIFIFTSVSIVFYQLIGLFTVPIMLVFSVIFCSVRAILFSGWLPRTLYHPEERIYPAFSRSLVYVKHNFTDLFKAYAIIFTLVYVIMYLCTMPTGGLTVLVIIPTHYFLLRTVELIGYYKAKGMSFYTDGSTVVNTVDYGFRPDNQEREDGDLNVADTAADDREAEERDLGAAERAQSGISEDEHE